MRQGTNPKRLRGRTGRKNPHNRSQNFESNGPEVKVRGNAQQVVEKYLALARDASLVGDRIVAENYFQHAEHYYRVMTANGPLEDRNSQNGRHIEEDDGQAEPAAGGAPPIEVATNGGSTQLEAGENGANGAVPSPPSADSAADPAANPAEEPQPQD